MASTRLRPITIARRFCGPPRSGNGGYSCGLLAGFVEGPAQVTLRSPPPLDVPLRVMPEPDRVALYHGDTLVGEACPVEVLVEVPPAPSLEAARAAEGRSIPPERHLLPGCFVCGPQRAPGDGLRIHAGPLDPRGLGWNGPLAAPWCPGTDLAGDDGLVRPEFLWAALDCPTGYASGFGGEESALLLGRQSVEIRRRPAPGEPCVVVAWPTGREGRRRLASGVLYGTDGTAIAVCRAVWIQVDARVMRGEA